MQPRTPKFDEATATSTWDLVQFFYNLASQGRGDGARGRYFYMLHILEYAYAEKIEGYQPSRATDQWLVLLFDVVNNYYQPYNSTPKQNRYHIQQSLKQSFSSFIDKVRQIGWQQIAHITTALTRRYIIRYDSSLRYLSEEQAHHFISNMSMETIFKKYTEQPQEPRSSEGKHPIAISRLKHIRKKFATLYAQVLADHRQSKEDNQEALTIVDIIAMLPFSGIRVLAQVVAILEKHENLFPYDYSFATFYALISNASASKEHARHKYKPRLWHAPQSYIPSDSNDDAIYNVFIAANQQQKKANPLQRNYELARLGLSRSFARAIYIIDICLRIHERNLQKFHYGQPWYEAIQENINEIDALSAQIRGQVALSYQQQKAKA